MPVARAGVITKYQRNPSGYVAAVLASSPAIYLPLETNNVRLAGSHNATVIGSPNYGSLGIPGTKLVGTPASSSNSYWTVPEVTTGINDFVAQSLEFWLYNPAQITTSTPGGNIISGTAVNGSKVALGAWTAYSSNEIFGVDRASNQNDHWTGTLAAGWHHHAIVYTGSLGSWTWYVDGQNSSVLGTVNKVKNGAAGWKNGGTLTIGALPIAGNYAIAHFARYAKALSAAEVAAHWAARDVA